MSRPRYLQFVNCTSRIVDIIAIDSSDESMVCHTLRPRSEFEFYIFEDKTFFAEDNQTKTPMLLNKLEYFEAPLADDLGDGPRPNNDRPGPGPNPGQQGQNNEGSANPNPQPTVDGFEAGNLLLALFQNRRNCGTEKVNITLPVLSLMRRSAEIVFCNLRKEDEIEKLGVPKRVEELLHSMRNSEFVEEYLPY